MILDVRTAEEFAAGHVDGAVHIPLADIERGVVPDCSPDTAIRVYCRSGGRAGMAVELLIANGFNAECIGGLHEARVATQA